jgi:hypothetical protein
LTLAGETQEEADAPITPFATCVFSLVPEHVAAGLAEDVDGVPPEHSCVLDIIAARGETSLTAIGTLTGSDAGSVYRVIARALRTIERRPVARMALQDFVADEHRAPARAEIVSEDEPPIEGTDETEADSDEWQDEAASSGRFLDHDEEAACTTVWRIYERASRERAGLRDSDDGGPHT